MRATSPEVSPLFAALLKGLSKLTVRKSTSFSRRNHCQLRNIFALQLKAQSERLPCP